MSGLHTLDILIGLFTVFLLFSTICTAIVEAIAAWSGVRSKNLESALKEFISGNPGGNNNVVTQFYDHPLIKSLSKNEDGRPSYIPAKTFRQVIESLVIGANAGSNLIESIRQLPDDKTNNLAGILKTLANEADGDEQRLRLALESHFDAVMDRASGWYKRHAQNVTYAVAMVLVLSFNVDTLVLVKQLSSNPEVLQKLLTVTEEQVKGDDKGSTSCTSKSKEEELKEATCKTESAQQIQHDAVNSLISAGVSIGWTDWDDFYDTFRSHWLAKIAGLLISIIAVSLGAPFWFDILQRFMQIRAAGQKPGTPEKP